MNRDKLESLLRQTGSEVKNNHICDVINEGIAKGLSGVVVKKWYVNAALDYRARHDEPDTIQGRLDYADAVKDYSAAYARKLIAQKIDSEQTRMEL